MDFILCHRLCEEQPETGREFLFLRSDKLFRGKAVEKDSQGIYRIIMCYTSSNSTIGFFDYGKDVVWAYVDEVQEKLSAWLREKDEWI